MPYSSPKPCTFPGCGVLVREGGSRCAKHKGAERREHDKRRPTSARRGYGSRWQKARAVYLAEHPTCNSCGKPAEVVDHIRPARGESELFWDLDNWQSMCKRCHDAKTAREDGGFGNLPRPRGGQNL